MSVGARQRDRRVRSTLWSIVPIVVLALGVQGQSAPKRGEESGGNVEKKDAYSGRTVKSPRDGMGLIQARSRNCPRVGEMAPDFTLKTADGKRSVTLSSFRGKRPVVLVFGSFT